VSTFLSLLALTLFPDRPQKKKTAAQSEVGEGKSFSRFLIEHYHRLSPPRCRLGSRRGDVLFEILLLGY
jgi:hypothetical protein